MKEIRSKGTHVHAHASQRASMIPATFEVVTTTRSSEVVKAMGQDTLTLRQRSTKNTAKISAARYGMAKKLGDLSLYLYLIQYLCVFDIARSREESW